MDEVDVFAAYCADVERCFFLPLEVFRQRRQIQLRLAGTRNNHAVGIHWADEFDFSRLDWKAAVPGAIAQLGERLHGMQEVGGSIPPGSTNLRRFAATACKPVSGHSLNKSGAER